MRRAVPVVLLSVLALVAVGVMALAGGRASAAEEDSAILYGSFVDNISFSQGGMKELAPGMYFRFGASDVTHGGLFAVAFDLFVIPSTQTQVYTAFVDSDEGAAALANAIYESGAQGVLVGVNSSFRPPPSGGTHFGISCDSSGATCVNVRFVSPPGGEVRYFKLTIPPFHIEQELLYGTFGPPQPGNTLHPDGGPMDIVEMWGTPPPGDANCTASVDSLDALAMLQHSAGLLEALSCAKAADVNADGTVDARDVQLVLQFTAGLIDAL